MFINFTKKYIFVAVPRTGSTGIQSILAKLSIDNNEDFYFNNSSIEITQAGRQNTDKDFKHLTYDQIISEFQGLSDYKMFHFVRNPYDRIASDFFLRRREARALALKQARAEVAGKVEKTPELLWEKKILEFKEQHKGLSVQDSFSKLCDNMYPPELRYSVYSSYAGGCVNKIVCRFEDFNIQLLGVLSGFGYDVSKLNIPVTNSNEVDCYEYIWNENLRDRIYKSFLQDFEDYGYDR